MRLRIQHHGAICDKKAHNLIRNLTQIERWVYLIILLYIFKRATPVMVEMTRIRFLMVQLTFKVTFWKDNSDLRGGSVGWHIGEASFPY